MIGNLADAQEHHASCLAAKALAEKELEKETFERNYEKSRIDEGRRHMEDLRGKFFEAKEALERRKPNLAVCDMKLKEAEDRMKENVRNCQISEAFLKECNLIDEEAIEEGAGAIGSQSGASSQDAASLSEKMPGVKKEVLQGSATRKSEYSNDVYR